MTDLQSAVLEVASLLDELGYAYMLIGGLAVAIWAEPRATLDVDVSVWTAPEEFDNAVQRITARVRSIPDALEFTRRTRVLPVMTSRGVRADIVFAALPEEREMISRALWKAVGNSRIRVAAVEDLVLMKLISERPKDLEDARRLIRRFRSELDRVYLEPKLKRFAGALARPDIFDTYQMEMGPS